MTPLRTSMLVALLAVAPAAAQDLDPGRISTGSSTGTYIQIGRDIYSICGFRPQSVLTSNGSVENVRRLLDEEGEFRDVKLAIIQSDVVPEMKKVAGRVDLARYNNIQLISPLYLEEIHVIVRKDSPIKTLNDLQGKRVNIGPQGSGVNITATQLGERLGIAWRPVLKEIPQSIEDVVFKDVDAAIIVGGAPYPHLQNLKQKIWADHIRMVEIPANEAKLKGFYLPTTIPEFVPGTNEKEKMYPWQEGKLQTFGVPSVLVGYNLEPKVVEKIVIQIFKDVDIKGHTGRLLTPDAKANWTPHKKWQQVQASLFEQSGEFGLPVNPTAGKWLPLIAAVIASRPND